MDHYGIEKKAEEWKILQQKLSENSNISIEKQWEMLRDTGLDTEPFENLTADDWAEKVGGLMPYFTKMLESIQKLQSNYLNPDNKDSKAVLNFSEHIKNREKDETQQSKLHQLFFKYYQSEIIAVGEECFHFNQNDCDDIIDAHSLQYGGPLKSISINDQVIQIKYNELKGERIPEPIARIKASTFRGFCHEHDSIFQKTIEKFPFDGSSMHCFLHSYRSFAFSYNKMKSDDKYHERLINGSCDAASEVMNSLVDIVNHLGLNLDIPMPNIEEMSISEDQELAMEARRFEKYRSTLNDFLAHENYHGLDYLVYQIQGKVPFACASWIESHMNIGDSYVIDDVNEIYNGYPIMITILPGEPSTVILSRFQDDKICKLLFDKLKKLKEKDLNNFNLVLSSMILRFVDNLYISPKFWNSIDHFIQQQLIQTMDESKNELIKIPQSKDIVNLFSDAYHMKT